MKNIYYLCPNFRKIKNFPVKFEPETFKDKDLKLRQFTHSRLFHNTNNIFLIILCNHYQMKISEFKNQVLKIEFKI